MARAQDSDAPRAAPARSDDDRRDDRSGGTGRQLENIGIGILANHAGDIADFLGRKLDGRRTLTPLAQVTGLRPGSSVPPPDETRLIPDEVVIEVSAATAPRAIAALALRNTLTVLEQLASQLSGTRLLRARILGQRSVGAVVAALEADPAVLSAQPNYLFALAAQTKDADPPLQYALEKMHLPQAHALAKGDRVLVAIIDSGVDAAQPEIKGAVVGSFDALGGTAKPHSHGTAIAGLIAAHGKLTGSAPAARLLVVRAFDSDGTGAQGSTFNILKGLDWAAVHSARVINMSFAGPADPAIHRSLQSAFQNAIVLVAAAGNAGPKSAPLYPAADPHVIAVTATDAQDAVFPAANRGDYIAVAAPGVDLLVATPGNGMEISSGTSLSAAEVSGVVALMLQRQPKLDPDAVREHLLATSAPLPGRERLVNAYQVLTVAPGP